MNYLSKMNALPKGAGSYFKESKQELKNVQWPTRAETIKSTIVILSVSLVVAVATGVIDATLTKIIQQFIIN